VMQKELAKKQKAMRRTRTIAHRSQAIRLNKRDCSRSVELCIINIWWLLLGVAICVCSVSLHSIGEQRRTHK
jgi:hypothetical protein